MSFIWLLLAIWALWLWGKSRTKAKEKKRAAQVAADQVFIPQPRPGGSVNATYNRLNLDLEAATLAARVNSERVAQWVEGNDSRVARAAGASEQRRQEALANGHLKVDPRSMVAGDMMAALGIEHREGKYRYRGYAFTTLEQAIGYARRFDSSIEWTVPPRRAPTPAPAQAPAPVPMMVKTQPVATPHPRWFAKAEGVDVAGSRIDGGLIYVGKPRPGEGWDGVNCLIDPSLSVARANFDHSGYTLGYWCSYRTIQPAARASYLEWLKGGRSDAAIGIGYVFLFFYGLERRLFVDQAFDEVDDIVGEVRRLLSIYGENYSFRSYAQRLLDAADLIREKEIARPPITPDLRNGYEIPLSVRRYLGKLLTTKDAFDAEDSLLWVLALPDTYLRTAGVRCFQELEALWAVRFLERYPSGLRVRTPKSRLSGFYRAASGNFEARISLGDLPDISAVSAPLPGLRDLLTSCMDDLDAYSRLLGRKPEARGTLEAALCLPSDLSGTPFAAGVQKVRDAFEALLSDAGVTAVGVRRLCDLTGVEASEAKLSAATQRQLAATLDRLDVAFEPDRRYGGGSLVLESEAVIFRAARGGAVDPDRPEYMAARTMVEIAALAATADGVVAPAEFDSISRDLGVVTELSTADRTRLLAHAFHLLRDPPRQQGALNRLLQLPTSQRATVTRSAIAAVLADGHVRPEEVRFLEKLHKTLGLPQDDVYAALHRGSVVVDEPIVIASEQWAKGSPIPAAASSDVTIDPARLARIRSETSEVSALLAGIFSQEEEPLVLSTPVRSSDSPQRFHGLDAAHASLLQTVVRAQAMSRPDFERHVRMLKLLPDGAFGTINEWGFETFDEPVLDGEDEVMAVTHLRDQLNAMGTGQ